MIFSGWDSRREKVCRLLLLGGTLDLDDLAEHDDGVALHDGDTAQTLAVCTKAHANGELTCARTHGSAETYS